MLADGVGPRCGRPIVVHAQEPTLAVLRTHIFNNAVWPDFTAIPLRTQPFLRLAPLVPEVPVTIAGRRFTGVEVTHPVPAPGHLVEGRDDASAFSGDTTSTERFWQALNACARLRTVIVETSFLDADEALSRLAGHLCPRLLGAELATLAPPAEICITHPMPGEKHEIMAEIRGHLPGPGNPAAAGGDGAGARILTAQRAGAGTQRKAESDRLPRCRGRYSCIAVLRISAPPR